MEASPYTVQSPEGNSDWKKRSGDITTYLEALIRDVAPHPEIINPELYVALSAGSADADADL